MDDGTWRYFYKDWRVYWTLFWLVVLALYFFWSD